MAENRIPELSIIIVTHNLSDKTINCIKSIRANEPMPHEILWVENGSAPDEYSQMRYYFTRPRMRTKLIRFKDNQGFIKGVNAAIPELHKRTKYVVLLNNDTIVGHRTFSKLIKPLAKDKKIGATGPITQSKISWACAEHLNRRWPDLKLPVFKGEEVNAYTKKLENKYSGKCMDVGKIPLAFFCTAFRKDVFVDVLGGLDQDFGIGIGEDDAACHKLRFLGYKLYLVLDAFVFHHHRSSFKFLNISIDSIRRTNLRTLRRKVKELDRSKKKKSV